MNRDQIKIFVWPISIGLVGGSLYILLTTEDVQSMLHALWLILAWIGTLIVLKIVHKE